MKLFQQLLVAPAALGLMAPMAANAADLNIQGVSDYSASGEQVTSINQFADVQPYDWAYQALSNLIERYGCVAGYPSGSYLGNRAMTRFEAAALLNACLDRVTEVTDELRRLLKEFEQELAVLKGRVDGLEARVGELEATQFSTTTKLVGQATMVVGANTYGGEKALVEAAENQSGAAVFNYDLRLDLNTSFTGEDLLKTRLRAGNFAESPFGADGGVGTNAGYNGLTAMEVAFGEEGDEDEVTVDRLYYQFPVGDDFTVTAGAKVRQDDMLAVWPSAYPADTIIDFFTYAGAPGAYSLTLGGGAGIWWQQDNCDNAENCGGGEWSISASYVSANADNGNPNRQDRPAADSGLNDPTGGIGTDAAAATTTAQIAFTDEQWGIAGVYSYSSGDNGAGLYAGNGTPLAVSLQPLGTQNSFGLSGYWTPEESGWLPSISAGWGISSTSPNDESDDILDSVTTQSWYAGLMWDDAFIEGNTLGFAGGQPTFVTDLDLESGEDDVEDANYAFELWYQFQVTDNISVTPAIFYFTRPLGEQTGSDEDEFTNFGALVKTTFKF